MAEPMDVDIIDVVPQCASCVHFQPGEGLAFCAAYPDGDGIPEEIILNQHDHREPFPGDHGVRFEQEIPLEEALQEDTRGSGSA